MPVTLEWFNADKTILLETFQGNWTLQDYYDLVDQAAAMLATVEHRVHIIVDATHNGALPTQMTSGMRYALRHLPPNQGITVFVGVNALVRVFIGIAGKLSPQIAQSVYTVETVQEAQAIIARHNTENQTD